LCGLDWTPGQHVKVFFRPPANIAAALRSVGRDYSIWDYHDDGRLQLRVFLHGADGPGERWAANVAPGDEVALTRPEGHLVASAQAPYHVVVGDDTGTVPFGAILRRLSTDAPVYGAIEVDNPDERPQLPRDSDLAWVYRHGAAAASSTRLVDAVRELPLPATPGVAYVAGEARTCQLVRDHLTRERGWSRRSVVTKAFWAPDRRGG
jgi:NADPH-dependent ferric siderophore reductase